METTAIVWLMVTLFIAVLIGYSIRKRITKEKNNLKKLQDLADKSNGKISEYEHALNTLIGIDKKSQQLFFIRKMPNEEVIKTINLADVQICRINNVSRVVNNGNTINTSVIDRLELSLKYKKPNNADEVLEFYNTNNGNYNLNGELQLTEKWNTIINEEIKKSNKI